MTKIHNLMPRLIHHNENQAEYYQRQLESAQRELGRLMIIDSGQMMLWDEPVSGSPFRRRANYGYIEGDESQDRQGRPILQSLGEDS